MTRARQSGEAENSSTLPDVRRRHLCVKTAPPACRSVALTADDGMQMFAQLRQAHSPMDERERLRTSSCLGMRASLSHPASLAPGQLLVKRHSWPAEVRGIIGLAIGYVAAVQSRDHRPAQNPVPRLLHLLTSSCSACRCPLNARVQADKHSANRQEAVARTGVQYSGVQMLTAALLSVSKAVR